MGNFISIKLDKTNVNARQDETIDYILTVTKLNYSNNPIKILGLSDILGRFISYSPYVITDGNKCTVTINSSSYNKPIEIPISFHVDQDEDSKVGQITFRNDDNNSQTQALSTVTVLGYLKLNLRPENAEVDASNTIYYSIELENDTDQLVESQAVIAGIIGPGRITSSNCTDHADLKTDQGLVYIAPDLNPGEKHRCSFDFKINSDAKPGTYVVFTLHNNKYQYSSLTVRPSNPNLTISASISDPANRIIQKDQLVNYHMYIQNLNNQPITSVLVRNKFKSISHPELKTNQIVENLKCNEFESSLTHLDDGSIEFTVDKIAADRMEFTILEAKFIGELSGVYVNDLSVSYEGPDGQVIETFAGDVLIN